MLAAIVVVARLVAAPAPRAVPPPPVPTIRADTLRPGSAALSPSQLRPYTIARCLELTRGDSTRPFGRQSEQLVLEFGAGKVRTTITPADGATTVKEAALPTEAFEWNMLPVALAALDLHEGDRLVLPIFSDRAERMTWYTVDVSADSLTRPSGRVAPMWRLRATPAGEAPSAEWWVSRRHHVLDQARVAEPGVAMLYARADL